MSNGDIVQMYDNQIEALKSELFEKNKTIFRQSKELSEVTEIAKQAVEVCHTIKHELKIPYEDIDKLLSSPA